MASASVRVVGADELAAGFAQLRDYALHLEEPSRRAAAGLIAPIRAGTPVRTGALASSWVVGSAAGGASVVSPLTYALPIEVGTRRGVEPHHMVRDALTDHGGEVVGIYRDALADRAKRLGFRVSR